LADDFLHRHADVKLLDLGIYTDMATARDSEGKNLNHFTYRQWLNEFQGRTQQQSTAELLKNGGDATLRIRYSDGRREEITVAGQNVFHPIVGGIAVNLLYVTCVHQGFGATKQLFPHLYFTAPINTVQEATSVSRAILSASRIPAMEVLIRRDQWFIFNEYYPWVNPFAASQGPPTETEAAQSPEFLCKPTTEERPCYQTAVANP
jgi:hypothetical protein